MKHFYLFPICLLLALLMGCASPDTPTLPPGTEPSPQTEASESTPAESVPEMDALLSRMTLRQKVGQLFIVCPEALDASGSGTALTDAMINALEEYPVGGVVMFSQNILSPEQITAFQEDLQDFSAIPLFLSVDEEGGSVARLANNAAFTLPRYKSAAAVGADGDPALALEMGSTIGSYLREYGFNMDFAPVADVNTNPRNPVIGSRAFSSDAGTAAQMASAMAEGLRQQDIIPVFKHFPGHGDTAEDSHSAIAVSTKTAEELASCEWLPFQEAGPLDCVMVGHIALPEVTGDLVPASMSPQIVTGILKEQLGFQGLVITDSLSMAAVTDNYTPGDAAVAALQAGCDILLMPEDLPQAFSAVLAALEDGRLSEKWLDETVLRILQFKQAHGILFL